MGKWRKAEIQPGVWREWRIESVELQHPKDRDPFREPSGIPPDAILATARGHMGDGRKLVCRMLLTQDFFNDLGENKVSEMIEEWARPTE